jgi:hypothetical protein
MNNDHTTGPAAGISGDALSDAEASLGQALALIHRILPRLDEPNRASEVQTALQRAAACVESARQAHQRTSGSGRTATAAPVQTRVEAETVAVISAAVAAILDRPYRLVSVQLVAAPVPHLNVWALEGRTQIFQSHKIR